MDPFTRSNHRQAREDIIAWMMAGVVPFIQSSPGMGKSAMIKSIAKELNLEVIDHRLSTSDPADLSGYPDVAGRKAVFKPFSIFPLHDDPIPKEKNGWLLFLDEFNSSSKATQAAAYKLILDRFVGQEKLHDNCLIVCAGNLSTDRAIVNALGTAMQSRITHIELELNTTHFIEDVVVGQGWDHRLAAYFSYKPSSIHDFKSDHNNKTFCCPRTWEFVNKLIQGKEIVTSQTSFPVDGDKISRADAQRRIGQAITAGIGIEFLAFVQLFDHLPHIRDVEKDPMGISVPAGRDVQYAAVAHLAEHVTEENLSSILAYVERFSTEFLILFMRTLAKKKPFARKNPDFVRVIREKGRFIHGS